MMSDRIARREFLARAGKYSLYSALAFGFGCTVSRVVEEETKKVAVVYGTRYGATKDTAHWISEGIGEGSAAFDIDEIFPPYILTQYDYFILGSGIWTDGVHPGIREFISDHREGIEEKILASFIVCGTDPSTVRGRARITGYFEQLHGSLDRQPVFNRSFGGRIVEEQLTDEDRQALADFYRDYLNRELTDWDRTDPDGAREFGNELNISFVRRPEVAP